MVISTALLNVIFYIKHAYFTVLKVRCYTDDTDFYLEGVKNQLNLGIFFTCPATGALTQPSTEAHPRLCVHKGHWLWGPRAPHHEEEGCHPQQSQRERQ